MERSEDTGRGSPARPDTAAGTTRPTADVFAADPETGRDLAAVDWSATPLGPPDDWPQSLRTAVDIMLSSRFAMWMAWGPHLTFFCNAAYRRATLGRKYPWALGRPSSEVWEEVWEAAGPRIDAVLTTGRATWDETLPLFLERSGYPEETYHTFSYSPLRDDAGVVVGMLCVVSEDTDRVVGERRMATLRDLGSDPSAVRTEREMLAFADEQLDRNRQDLPFTLTYLFGADGGARLAGHTGIGTGHPAAPERLSPADPRPVWPLTVLARGETAVVELAGEPFGALPGGAWPRPPVRALAVPLRGQDGGPEGFLVAGLNRHRPLDDDYRGFVELVAGHLAAGIGRARSYAAQRRRAEELTALDRAKTAFFSNVSHEFRTPLTLIMGPVEELRTRLADADDGVREQLDEIHRNGLRLGRLVTALLDFSRIEAGRMRARREPVDLSAATAELAGVFRSAVERAGLVLDVDCPPLDRPVHVDRGMWEKVVLNLLSNALKFTFDGAIRVAVRADGDAAVLTVSDTGTGVPADEVPRLFERFHRVENARARSHEGSGIGLALVRELVRLHGGTITARSTLGEGTTFTVRLPCGAERPPADRPSPGGPPDGPDTTAEPFLQEALRWLPDGPDGAAAGRGPGQARSQDGTVPRILVADDNADMRDYLLRLLTAAGYRADAVTDGRAALDSARADAPDLVVSDVMMPRLDGLALVAALRADVRTAAVPVLLLSARAGQDAAVEGLAAGADDYLVKPFSAAELLARVRATVALARLRSHHARWRTALVDSLQEAFFVSDDEGAVIETNAAFTRILGYGPEHLPYALPHPWWPDPAIDREAHRLAAEAFARMRREEGGTCTVPVTRRDGRRLWVAAAFNRAADPDTGRPVTVGTFRDVTAEHRAVQRDAALSGLGLRLAEAASLPDALAAALDELRGTWQAAAVHAVVLPPDGPPTLTSTTPGLDWAALPAAERAALTAQGERPLLTPAVDGTAAAVTLEHPHGRLVLHIRLDAARTFDDQDALLLTLLAGRLAQGLHRAHQIDQQRETAITLQRAILGPGRLPEGFAVRYEPAARPLEVGGDWYDTVPLPDGRTGIVVGDCVGRGLTAATVMGQLRSACRALLLQDASPARVLTALDRFAAGVPGALCSTVFCGVLDPDTGDLVYSSAGHPPGIIAEAAGTGRLLESGRSYPLAVTPGRARPEARCTVPPRATLLLYTDGLVERRRRPLTEGIGRAGEAVQSGRALPLDDVATGVMAALEPPGGYEDDVALLLYRHPGPLSVSFAAESAQLAPVRRALRGWLDRCGLPPRAAQGVLVAAGEACANAVEHGHRDAPGGPVTLHAVATVDDLRLTVTDTGRWREPEPDANPHRGRGLALMRAMMERVTVTPGPTGTTVDLYTRIP